MRPIRHLTVIQRLLFGCDPVRPGFKHDDAELGSDKLQRERYPRGASTDNAQVAI
jgi:hypothetical protein